MHVGARQRGFTLLEVMIALAILGMSLMAIFQLNSQAVAMHAYTKRLTVASMLARAKMIDLEQELYDEGFQIDDQELSGGFEDEGWEMFKWRARIIAPETGDVSPEQFMGALFNLPIGDLGGDPLAAFAEMMGGSEGAAAAAGLPPGSTPGMSPLAGMAGGLMQQQFDQMLAQIAQQVREIHLTVSWKDGDQVETLDVVTHLVAEGTGGDRNAPAAPGGAGGQMGPGGTPLPPSPGGGQPPNPRGSEPPNPRGGLR